MTYKEERLKKEILLSEIRRVQKEVVGLEEKVIAEERSGICFSRTLTIFRETKKIVENIVRIEDVDEEDDFDKIDIILEQVAMIKHS